jgi:hypothetical protein
MKRNLPLIIIIIGIILRLIGLGWDSLWYDEAFTAWLAGLPLPAMMNAIAGDVHPPAWYLIEWVVVRVFGSSEIALRAPACALGIASLPLAWAVARRLAPRPVALVALAIFALSPWQIYYSQEARMYMLLQVAVLACVWAWLTSRWALLAAAGLVGLLAHNLMAVYLAPLFALALWYDFDWLHWGMIGWRSWLRSHWGPLVAAVLIMFNYVPWADRLLLPQISNVGQAFWVQPVSLGGFFYPIYVLFFYMAAPDGFQLHAGLLVLVLVFWGTAKAWTGARAIIILAWGPLALLAVISLLWKPVYLHRTLAGAALPLYLLAAFAIVRVAQWAPWPMLALAAPMFLLATGNYYVSPAARRWDIPPHTSVVQCAPGDVVYHVNLASLILFGYYLPDCDHWVWPAANDLSQSLTPQTKRAMGMQQAALDDVHGWRRAWLIWAETPVMNESEPGAVGEILLKHSYRLVHQVVPTPLVTLRIWEVSR